METTKLSASKLVYSVFYEYYKDVKVQDKLVYLVVCEYIQMRKYKTPREFFYFWPIILIVLQFQTFPQKPLGQL